MAMRRYWFLSGIFLLTGCANLRVRRIDNAVSRPAKPSNCEIRIVRRLVPTDRKLVPLADLSFSDPNGMVAAGPESVEQELRAKACELGADLVVIGSEHYSLPYVGTSVQATAAAYDEPVPRDAPSSQQI
jgi:hypothetical protein